MEHQQISESNLYVGEWRGKYLVSILNGFGIYQPIICWEDRERFISFVNACQEVLKLTRGTGLSAKAIEEIEEILAKEDVDGGTDRSGKESDTGNA